MSLSGGSLPGALNSQVLLRAVEPYLSNNVMFGTVSGGSLGYLMHVNKNNVALPTLDPASNEKWTLDTMSIWGTTSKPNSGAVSSSAKSIAFNAAAKALNFGGLKTCMLAILTQPLNELKKSVLKVISGEESKEEVARMSAAANEDGLPVDWAARLQAKLKEQPELVSLFTNRTAAVGRSSSHEAVDEQLFGLPLPASCAEFPSAPLLLKCAVTELIPSETPIWHCLVKYLAASTGVDIDNLVAGPRPWHVTYSAVVDKAMPIKQTAVPTPGFEKRIAVVSYEAKSGAHASNPALAVTGKRSLFWGLNTPEIDLADAVGYSSMFINMGIEFSHGGKRCAASFGLPPWALEWGTLIQEEKKTGFFFPKHKKLMTTDGGETEVLGIIPLLREKRSKIVSAFIAPHTPKTYQMSRLFGVGGPQKTCSGADALGTNMQVFADSSLWGPLSDAMTSRDNTGVHVLKSVQVQANPTLGVEAYTIETLIFIDNWSKSGFEEEVLDASSLAGLTSQGYPCTESACSLDVKPAVSVAMALLNQWKVQKNAAVLKEALAA